MAPDDPGCEAAEFMDAVGEGVAAALVELGTGGVVVVFVSVESELRDTADVLGGAVAADKADFSVVPPALSTGTGAVTRGATGSEAK